jgi:hypothetical protein
MSALLTANQVGPRTRRDSSILTSVSCLQFERTFPEVKIDDQHRNHATFQSLLVAIYVSTFDSTDPMRCANLFGRNLGVSRELCQIYGLAISSAANEQSFLGALL